uniref:Uncharacterized protein n=1 Tax=Microrhizoidea pickettheapsiorum TaxID=2604950 RepID=A0A5B9RKB8_9CHLO|nr:hypothetical protein [Microrhizoidea pickettheapsiorum]QEG77709.1 hypothetical protein [Microrhizoidea pickettheapsiorum]
MKIQTKIQGKIYIQLFEKGVKWCKYLLYLYLFLNTFPFFFTSSIFKNQICITVLLICFFLPQRAPFEGGLSRDISEQRFFIRYQRTSFFVFVFSLFILFIFFIDKLKK